MINTRPLVSVVIPTRNAGPNFEPILQRIRAQTLDGPLELVIVDSASSDGTHDLAARYADKVLPVDPHAFNHGGTRNLGISQTRGRYVTMLVQDAIPADNTWLAKLVAALESDSRVAGAYSRQLPHPGDSHLIKFLTHLWYRAQGEQRVVQGLDNIEDFAGLTFPQRRMLCGFEDVSSMLRRSVWEQIPLRPIRFAEDVDWAYRVIQAGYKVVYEPDSQVIHSHDRGFWYNAKRHYIDGRILMRILGADEASLRTWTTPRSALALAAMVLRDAAAHHALDLPLLVKTINFAAAAMLGSGLRRLTYPRVDQPHAPAWLQRLDQTMSRGV